MDNAMGVWAVHSEPGCDSAATSGAEGLLTLILTLTLTLTLSLTLTLILILILILIPILALT